MKHRVFIYSLLFIYNCIVESAINRQEIVFSQNTIHKDTIENIFPEKISVKDISFTCDCIFQKEEFFYLLGFSIHDTITAACIQKTLNCFAQKNKFSTISLITKRDEQGVTLHFIFESILTFKKVKIHNIYQGKQRFLQLYCMERGELFDTLKHEYALNQIKDFLLNEGYFNHSIISSFEYDTDTNEVIVHLFIKKGKRFNFGLITIDTVKEEVDDNKKNIQRIIQKKLCQSLVKRPYSKELLVQQENILKDYLVKKGYFYATIDLKEVINKKDYTVSIKGSLLLYKKKEIVFFGHRFFSKKQLVDTIFAFGQSVWLIPATLLAEEIIKVYKNKGFLNVEVKVEEEKERSFFIIKEGVRAGIAHIHIKNAAYSEIEDIKKVCFKRVLHHFYYDAQLYEDAINLLTKMYYEQGYFDFALLSHEFVPTNQENEYTLLITIDEGKRKYINSIDLEGYPELLQVGPFIQYKNEKNIPFTVSMLDEQRGWLSNHFQLLGYFHPKIKPVVETKNEETMLMWLIDPGEKIYFGKTIVLGSATFPFSYIQSLLAYKEGQLWSQIKIKESFRTLKNLDIFEAIHFAPDCKESTLNKSVLLKLDPDDRYEIRTRAGLELQHVRKYQTFSGLTYKLGGTTFIKNPSNCADQLRFDCDFTRSHREIIAQYKRPWFTPYPFFTTAQAYSIVYDQPAFIGSVNDIYTLIQNGFLFGLQKKSPYIDTACNIGFEWMKLQSNDNQRQLSFAQAIDFKPQLLDKMVPFFFTEPTIMVEHLDNPLNPTRGGVGLFSLKAMIPLLSKYKNSLFLKILAEQSLFIPFKKVVAAFRMRCGHIFYRDFSGIMPSERFYLGGSHSLRGYEADLAPPLGIFVDDNGQDHIVPRGGRTMVNANFELRFPVWKQCGGVIFQDLGALSGTFFADFKKQDLLAASGFGLRIFTPLGPLRFDIGWRWRKHYAIERSFAWFLTFGQAF